MPALQVPLSLENLERWEALEDAATPGPWRWEGNTSARVLVLVSGASWHPRVMDFVKWGLLSAQVRFSRSRVSGREMIEASEVCETASDGVVLTLAHPDAEFLAQAREAVPQLLAEVRRAWGQIASQERELIRLRSIVERGRASATFPSAAPENPLDYPRTRGK